MSRVDEILAIADHVPPFPKAARQVMQMVEDENVTAAELSEVIQYDANITANLLKTCNAAYFGLTRKVSSIDDALVILGHDTLKDIIVTSSSVLFFDGNAGDGYQLEEGDLWRHGVAVAIMSKSLCHFFKGVNGSAAFTAGLLHDIGKRFISSFVADDFKKIMALAHGDNCSFTDAELHVLGVNHAELGGMILKKWEFDDDMTAAVERHHDPKALEQGGLVALVALSNTLVVSMGVGVGADGLASSLQGEALARYGINNKELELAMANLFSELEKAEEMLNLTN
jgi:putative nucleotidyltransferase with HDIG domain